MTGSQLAALADRIIAREACVLDDEHADLDFDYRDAEGYL